MEQIRKHNINLAILDVMMPGMDGFQLIKKIREMYRLPILHPEPFSKKTPPLSVCWIAGVFLYAWSLNLHRLTGHLGIPCD